MLALKVCDLERQCLFGANSTKMTGPSAAISFFLHVDVSVFRLEHVQTLILLYSHEFTMPQEQMRRCWRTGKDGGVKMFSVVSLFVFVCLLVLVWVKFKFFVGEGFCRG